MTRNNPYGLYSKQPSDPTAKVAMIGPNSTEGLMRRINKIKAAMKPYVRISDQHEVPWCSYPMGPTWTSVQQQAGPPGWYWTTVPNFSVSLSGPKDISKQIMTFSTSTAVANLGSENTDVAPHYWTGMVGSILAHGKNPEFPNDPILDFHWYWFADNYVNTPSMPAATVSLPASSVASDRTLSEITGTMSFPVSLGVYDPYAYYIRQDRGSGFVPWNLMRNWAIKSGTVTVSYVLRSSFDLWHPDFGNTIGAKVIFSNLSVDFDPNMPNSHLTCWLTDQTYFAPISSGAYTGSTIYNFGKWKHQPAQSQFYAYSATERESLGVPDYGISIPKDRALCAAFSNHGAVFSPQHVIDMRSGISSIVTAGYFRNSATGMPFDWEYGSENNTYKCVVDRSKFNGESVEAYDWTRSTFALQHGIGPMDCDYEEIRQLVAFFESQLG